METHLSAHETALCVMVVYDDWSAGILATNLYNRICVRLPSGVTTDLSLWSFDALEHCRNEQFAFNDLRRADVLMVAADGVQPLPVPVQNTLEKWLVAREFAHVGLVGILYQVEEEEKELSPAHSFLEALARRARADFFCRAIAAPSQDESPLISARRPLTLDFVWDEDSAIASVPISHWGINE